ncbi:MAG: acyl-CoA thioesterase [Armatimonadetes bacterium]|nr:acyl-CoA thioesterase [Armatimonadota bacterium]
MYEYKYLRSVEFADADMAGILHFSNYFRFMESAEHAFFRAAELPVLDASQNPTVAWPRVNVQCTYRRALRYQDQVETHVVVGAKGRTSITFHYLMRKVGDAEEAARGMARVTAVSLDLREARMRAIPLPPEVDAKIMVAPPDVLTALKLL